MKKDKNYGWLPVKKDYISNNKERETLKMQPIDDAPTEEDFKNWKPPLHSFDYSQLHW